MIHHFVVVTRLVNNCISSRSIRSVLSKAHSTLFSTVPVMSCYHCVSCTVSSSIGPQFVMIYAAVSVQPFVVFFLFLSFFLVLRFLLFAECRESEYILIK